MIFRTAFDVPLLFAGWACCLDSSRSHNHPRNLLTDIDNFAMCTPCKIYHFSFAQQFSERERERIIKSCKNFVMELCLKIFVERKASFSYDMKILVKITQT